MQAHTHKNRAMLRKLFFKVLGFLFTVGTAEMTHFALWLETVMKGQDNLLE